MTARAIPLFVAALALAGPGTALAAPPAPKAAPAQPAADTAKPAPRPAADAAPRKARKPAPPLTVGGLLTEAKAATAKGDAQLALRLTQAAIVADPARPETYVALGDLYARAGEDEYARSYYQAALEINPADAAALGAMAALGKPGEKTAANRNAANDSGRAAGP